MPKFSATVQEHYVEHDTAESQVMIAEFKETLKKVGNNQQYSAPDILCLLQRGLLNTETVLRL